MQIDKVHRNATDKTKNEKRSVMLSDIDPNEKIHKKDKENRDNKNLSNDDVTESVQTLVQEHYELLHQLNMSNQNANIPNEFQRHSVEDNFQDRHEQRLD